jgi:LPXTG-motif cell wall-anchored protein
MKRQILSLATALVLMTAGAVFAQSTLNTTAPGPSQETKPGQTNNNLQNPGSNMQKPATTTATTVPSTATTTSTDMNNDSTVTPPADTTTTAPPVDTTTTTTTTTPTTNTYNNGSVDTSTTSTTTAPTSLPKTASDMPTVALMGLLALSGFFGVRAYAKRNA